MGLQDFDFATGQVLNPKRKQAILALEDSNDINTIKDVLRQSGYKVFEPETNPRTVLELVRKLKLGILFLDINIDGVSPKDVLPGIKKAFPEFNIIAISSSVTKESLDEILQLGAMGFLVKPVQTDALEKLMAKIK